YSCQWAGIAVYSSQYNTIRRNFVFQTRQWGVELQAHDNRFTDNIVNENQWGFALIYGSSRNTFINNTVNRNEVGFWLEYNNVHNVFINNTAEENTVSGFLMQGWYDPPYFDKRPKFNLFQNNTVRNNKYGFNIRTKCEQNNFTSNLVEGNEIGFRLNYVEKNTFSDNRVFGNDYGYHITKGSNHNQFVGEILADSQYHIYLNETVNITFFSTMLKNSSVGDVYLNNSSELNLFNTSFSTLTIDSTSTLNIKNYLRVRVVGFFGISLPNTDIKVISSDDVFNEIAYATASYGGSDPRTDGAGYSPWFLVTNTTYKGSNTPVLRTVQVYVKKSMVNFPGIPKTVSLDEPRTLTIKGLSVVEFFILSELITTSTVTTPLYTALVTVALVGIFGFAVYFFRYRK
ncbi:MAG: nitrous oxide reductase family maturation protein NosD, partial [Candidatus Lokiarchaeia archaeon]